MTKLRFLCATAFLLPAVCPAAWLAIEDRAKFSATERLDWGAVAANYDSLSSSLAAMSTQGTPVLVSQGGAAFVRLDQSAGWYGNFSPGESLLWTYYGGPVSLDFGPLGVTALGLQIQPDLYGEYTAQLDVFDAAGGLLNSVTGTGLSTALGDGSALFLGLQGNSSFHSARVSIQSGASLDSFAIGAVDFTAVGLPPVAPVAPMMTELGVLNLPVVPSATAVPEPATFTLAVLAVGGLAWLRRRL
jgi:uncharacterized protein (TIGR03382 family)